MTSQRDETAATRAADPAPGQAGPLPMTDNGLPRRPAGGTVPDDPVAADHDDGAAAAPVLAGEPVIVAGEAAGPDEPLARGDAMPSDDAMRTDDGPDAISAAALVEQQWPAILALFVDDPRGAVERAAAAAGAVAESIVATLEREQAQLRASVPDGADTEDLRTALQRYRAFCGRLEDLA
jgi:hypothetical protein